MTSAADVARNVRGCPTQYRGWHIDYYSSRPVTGRYGAARYGVTLCAHSMDAIRAVIDNHIESNKKEWQ